MKFVELKKALGQNLEKVYLLEGEDRFVVANALQLIEKKVNLTLEDVNKVVIEGEKATAEDILMQVNAFPFGDPLKLVVVREFNSKTEFKALENYLKAPSDFVILVFLNYSANEFTKKLKQYATSVDCSKLDDETIKAWIGSKLSKSNVSIEEGAIRLLINYSGNNLARINSELDKLMYLGESVINSETIKKHVVPDKDYQIYELTDFISKGEKDKVYDLVGEMLLVEKNPVGLIQYLYQSFRRLFVISLSTRTDSELAEILKVKPYAVKMARVQSKRFTPKKLKRINSDLAELEYKIKSGKANIDSVVQLSLSKILLGE